MHKSPQRAKQFLWLVLKGKLLTNEELVKRNITWDLRYPIVAESHAIWEGLLVAWFRQVIVESDCADAGTLINSSSQASSVLAVVNSIKELCNRQWTV
ncbi:hypothetical protein Godav_007274 [Gossypium davidsonii]|uniref:RNase H type-1 domain-containing protein n=1 Tax=Gossypium davidsonii TaxID=34287 RepID=A0A7J8S716_GOSDV|nr:hypothetical protein [Gossypium davidsonii]